tara:strand:+ start:28540 stop:29361 length:822 start_codon:yes stop_codon:yes gene_type:complete
MGYIGNQQTEGFSKIPPKQDLTGATGSTLTLSHAVSSPESIDLFINNVRQEPTESYTIDANGTTVNLVGYTVAATDDIYVVYNSLAQHTSTHPSNQALQATSGTFTGGIYLGGTASTNLLNNYVNDGTWQPYFSDINNNAIFNETPAIQEGTYQRIGDFVTVNGYLKNAASVTTTASYNSSGATYIGGLPFPVPAGNAYFYAGTVSYQIQLSGPSSSSLYDFTGYGFPLSIITEASKSVLRLNFAHGQSMLNLTNVYISANTALIFAVTYKVA